MPPDDLEIWETLVSAEGETLPIRETYRPIERGRRASVSALPRIALKGETDDADLRVKRTLGEGGMGVVHLAEQVAVGRDVAVKTVRPGREQDGLIRQSLLQEAWVTGVLEHPNIVPIYTLGEDGEGCPIIVMKRIEGVEWSELLAADEDRDEFGGREPIVFHLQVLAQVCMALHYAHSRGIIHRDLKPENVMIGSFGEVYLLDWGIAVSVEDDRGGRFPRVSQVTSPAGTPAYMAPEMTTGEPTGLGIRTDVYLVGSVLHEILTGSPPHDRGELRASLLHAYVSEPPRYGEDVPEELAAIATKAMAKDPAKRWGSIDELRQRLLDYLDHRSAYAILDEASRRHAEMLKAMERRAPGEVQDAFSAAKFGAEQALREWPGFEVAQEVWEELLTDMLRWDLEQENLSAATMHARDLGEAIPAELAERLERLRASRADREEEFERLRELERDVDTGLGRRTRSKLALLFGAVWGMSPLIFDEVVARGIAPLTYPFYLAQGIAIVVFFVAVLFIWRRTVLGNLANRRMTYGLTVMVMAVIDYRLYAWATDIELPGAIIAEFFIYGLGTAMLALSSELKLVAGTFIYFAGALIAGFFPHQTLPIMAICNMVATSYFAWVWRRPDQG